MKHLLLFLLLQTSWGVQNVQADRVWALTRGAGMTVAVVDSGTTAFAGGGTGGFVASDSERLRQTRL
jgi:hypothetical protein